MNVQKIKCLFGKHDFRPPCIFVMQNLISSKMTEIKATCSCCNTKKYKMKFEQGLLGTMSCVKYSIVKDQ